MGKMFTENEKNPPIPKNMPMNSGKIAWARSIITRIKAPVDKFKQKNNIFTSPTGKKAALRYVELAKILTEYEKKIYDDWVNENSTKVLEKLKNPILKDLNAERLVRQKAGHDPKMNLRINFDPKLKVIIREAKFLDRIGISTESNKNGIPDTIINIALQEKDYAKHIDKLNQLLRSYDAVLDDLKPIEK